MMIILLVFIFGFVYFKDLQNLELEIPFFFGREIYKQQFSFLP